MGGTGSTADYAEGKYDEDYYIILKDRPMESWIFVVHID